MVTTTCPHCHHPIDWSLWALVPSRNVPAESRCDHCGHRVRFPGWWHCISMLVILAVSAWLTVTASMAWDLSVPAEIVLLVATLFPLQIIANIVFLYSGGRLVPEE